MDTLPTASLEERLKTAACALGFELVGIAPAGEADGFDRLQDWLAQGFAGEMAYMERHKDASRHPKGVFADVKSVVMVALNYKPPEAEPGRAKPQAAQVARYARAAD